MNELFDLIAQHSSQVVDYTQPDKVQKDRKRSLNFKSWIFLASLATEAAIYFTTL